MTNNKPGGRRLRSHWFKSNDRFLSLNRQNDEYNVIDRQNMCFTSFLAFGNVELFKYLNCVQDRRLSDVINILRYAYKIGPVFTEFLVMKSDLVMLEEGVDNHA